MPEGTVYMHHAQDRLIDVPLTEQTGKRGGIHNSPHPHPDEAEPHHRRLRPAVLRFNYLGPTGNQRDEVTMIRRRTQEVEY